MLRWRGGVLDRYGHCAMQLRWFIVCTYSHFYLHACPPPPLLRRAQPMFPKIKLAAALRFLAGASYLDLAFMFAMSHKHVMRYVWEACEAIDKVLDNVKFPIDDYDALKRLEAGFISISGRHADGKPVFPGTVAAGDGVVFPIVKPPSKYVDGNVASFFTRKGYYAYGLQAFVDASCRFLSISSRLSSSTHDSTSYVVSSLSKAISEGRLHSDFHIVLDEAYPCTEQEISPYKGRKLSPQCDAFNFHLSLHRQPVERAFSLVQQRFGVLWREIRVRFDRIPLLIIVCCKLHNLCIERFGVGEAIKIYRQDSKPDDEVNVQYTDGTGLGRGYRSDLEWSGHRQTLTTYLSQYAKVRPSYSLFSRVERI